MSTTKKPVATKKATTTKSKGTAPKSKKKFWIILTSIIGGVLLLATAITVPIVLLKTNAEPNKPAEEVKVTKVTFGKDGMPTEVLYSNGTFEYVHSDDITSTTTPATCEAAGKTVYVLKLKDGSTYTTEEAIAPLGHNWSFSKFVWSENYNSAQAEYNCASCNETRLDDIKVNMNQVEPTCEEEGKITYSVELVYNDVLYTETKEVVLPALDHDWNFTKYTWSEDFTSCVANFICKNDFAHSKTEEVEVVATLVLKPTCHKDGLMKYTVDTVYGVETKEVVIPALGHDFTEVYTSEHIHVEACTRCDAEMLEYQEMNTESNKVTYTKVTKLLDSDPDLEDQTPEAAEEE